MTLDDFDSRIEFAYSMQREGEALRLRGLQVEESVYRIAGIVSHNREPGFPCWTHKDLKGYYNTPREAIKALQPSNVS